MTMTENQGKAEVVSILGRLYESTSLRLEGDRDRMATTFACGVLLAASADPETMEWVLNSFTGTVPPERRGEIVASVLEALREIRAEVEAPVAPAIKGIHLVCECGLALPHVTALLEHQAVVHGRRPGAMGVGG